MPNFRLCQTNPRQLHLRLSRMFGLAALCLLAFGCTHAQTAASEAMEECSMTQTADKDGKFKISLERAGATGFQWFFTEQAAVRVLQQGEEALKNDLTGLTGGAVRQWWNFQIVQPKRGQKITLDFYLYRSWEGKDRSARHCRALIGVQ